MIQFLTVIWTGFLTGFRETGGYGIGRSVARAIVTSHGGTIEALRDGDKIIRFVVTLPKQQARNNQKNK